MDRTGGAMLDSVKFMQGVAGERNLGRRTALKHHIISFSHCQRGAVRRLSWIGSVALPRENGGKIVRSIGGSHPKSDNTGGQKTW